MNGKPQYVDYWNINIERWAELYLDASHGYEQFDRPPWFNWLYARSIGRLERRMMRSRYQFTRQFIQDHVRPGDTVADLGCGPGLFVIESIKSGAGAVHAVDFSASSLAMTRQAVERVVPGASVAYCQADVQVDQLPRSDVAIAMGLTPYLTDLPAFLDHAIGSTGILLCLYADSEHWANRLRGTVPFLNVRGLNMYSRSSVGDLYRRHGATLLCRTTSGTCFMDVVATPTCPPEHRVARG